MYARLSPAASTATTRSGLQLYIAVQVRKSAEGRAPVAMQLAQLLHWYFFDTTDATSATGATLSTILRIFVKESSKAKGKHTCGRWMSV